jgi:hypothetical protein
MHERLLHSHFRAGLTMLLPAAWIAKSPDTCFFAKQSREGREPSMTQMCGNVDPQRIVPLRPACFVISDRNAPAVTLAPKTVVNYSGLGRPKRANIPMVCAAGTLVYQHACL